MDKWELEKEREKAFEKWFDKWSKESKEFKDIEQKIRERNLKGYTSIEIKIEYTDEQPSVRVNSHLFLEKLKERFPELTVMARDTIGCLGKIIIINWGLK